MRPTFLMTWPATLITPSTTTDGYGDEVEDGTTETAILVHASPGAGREDSVEARTTVAAWSVFCPPDTPVTSASRIQLDAGPLLEVISPPAPFRNPRTRTVEYVQVDAQVVV